MEVVGKMVKRKKFVEGGSNDERADCKDPKELKLFVGFVLFKSWRARGRPLDF